MLLVGYVRLRTFIDGSKVTAQKGHPRRRVVVLLITRMTILTFDFRWDLPTSWWDPFRMISKLKEKIADARSRNKIIMIVPRIQNGHRPRPFIVRWGDRRAPSWLDLGEKWKGISTYGADHGWLVRHHGSMLVPLSRKLGDTVSLFLFFMLRLSRIWARVSCSSLPPLRCVPH